ncbi:hypothetical protein BDEG_27312 [Batrachochytrium dendrobatidis JEL423]|uniref:Uncharacterized protein n=1 Tax=Batrachochytrium dendrobatidis (strain JEL423) TaxID=403673 RepID=A0A177WWE5_BATDL|nr:hypothetical protein BDEG_27312 [Batrachochytrium dendrobatidis JEL423]
MAALGPMALVDYLDKYVTSCENRQISPVMAVKKTVERAIDSGEMPDIMKLNGTITELRYHRIDDGMLETIFLPMVGLSLVRHIDLSYNEIGNRGAFAIAKVLKDDNAMETLILKSNNIGSEGVIAITKSLAYNEKLIHLDLSENNIGDDGGMAMASLLQSNNYVSNLDLSNNLSSASNRSQTLVNDVMMHFSKTIQLNYAITHLNFSKMGITDWNMCDLLASALKANKNIETLNLSCNRISRDGGVALCNALMKHSSVNNLILSCCSIQDEGAIAIAQISNTGLVAIAKALRNNSGVKYISLWGNQWGETSCEEFAELMQEPLASKSIEDFTNTSIKSPKPVSAGSTARLQPHMLDVSFYVVEDSIHVAHSPRK